MQMVVCEDSRCQPSNRYTADAALGGLCLNSLLTATPEAGTIMISLDEETEGQRIVVTCARGCRAKKRSNLKQVQSRTCLCVSMY